VGAEGSSGLKAEPLVAVGGATLLEKEESVNQTK